MYFSSKIYTDAKILEKDLNHLIGARAQARRGISWEGKQAMLEDLDRRIERLEFLGKQIRRSRRNKHKDVSNGETPAHRRASFSLQKSEEDGKF